MKYYPRRGYEEHLNIYGILANGDEATRRDAFGRQQKLLKNTALPAGTQVETLSIPGPEADTELALRIIRPEGLPKGAPIIMDIHGGGWIGGSAAGDDFRCALLADGVRCIVISVEYRLAPKHPFPAALMDCYTAYCWIHAHAEELSGDPNRLGLHGTSAGGNLTAALSLYLRDHGGPSVSLAAIVNGAFSLEKTMSSHQIQAYPLGPDAGYSLSPEAQYLGNLNGQQPSYYAFPALCPMLMGFPPALIIASEYDQLRDDSLLFAQRLYAEGVPCELVVAPRVGHGFMAVDNALTRQFFMRMADSFRNAFDML